MNDTDDLGLARYHCATRYGACSTARPTSACRSCSRGGREAIRMWAFFTVNDTPHALLAEPGNKLVMDNGRWLINPGGVASPATATRRRGSC